MTDQTRYLDPAEFRRLGLLQETNRIVLHPCGIALDIDEGGQFVIVDHRHDSRAGITYTTIDPALTAAVKALVDQRRPHRERLMGAVVQPADWTSK